MKIKKGFVIQQVGGQWVAVATGSAAVEFSGIVKLNDTAAIAWKGVEEAFRVSRSWLVLLSPTMSTNGRRAMMSMRSCRRSCSPESRPSSRVA